MKRLTAIGMLLGLMLVYAMELSAGRPVCTKVWNPVAKTWIIVCR